MKYLFSYSVFKQIKMNEDFKTQKYTVGDIVKLNNGHVAKIVKINSKYSYLVKIMHNSIFSKNPIEIKEYEISGLVKSNSEPAIGTDLIMNPSMSVTNDLVINGGYPEIPLANVLNY